MVNVCFSSRNPAGSESQPDQGTTEYLFHGRQAVSEGEKDFLSGTMSTASEADKNVLGFLFLKWLLDEARDSSSPHNQKRWKFGISYQQVKTAFFSLQTHSSFHSSMVVCLFLWHLFGASVGPLGKSPTYTPFPQDMSSWGRLPAHCLLRHLCTVMYV